MSERVGQGWAVRLTVLALSLLLGLGILELGFRLCRLKRLTIDAGIEHPHFHHRLKPEETYHFYSSEFDVRIHTNRFGLRGPTPAIPKPAGTVRVLMLGDSYTFGFPVQDEETFCALAERGLRARGLPVEVINGGVSGYSPTLHYLSLRDEFLQFEPDLVILWYDLGDLQEDTWFQKNLLYDAQGRIVRCDPRYTNGRFDRWEWLKSHSVLAKYLDTKLLRTLYKIRTLGLGGYLQVIQRGERAKVAIARLKRAQQAPDLAAHDLFLLVREDASDELIASYWSLSAQYLRLIRDLLAERKIPFLLGIYPYGMLVGPDQWGQGRVYWGFEPGRTYDASHALALFQRFAQEEQIPLLNTFDSFTAAAHTEQLFYAWDGHFTPAGQRVVAEYLLHDAAFLTSVRRAVSRRRPPADHDS